MDNITVKSMAGISNIYDTVEDRLDVLCDTKEDLKNALIRKGVTPQGGLSTYAFLLSEPLSGGYKNLMCFGRSTCTNAEPFVEILKDAKPRSTYRMFEDCLNLTEAPLFNTSNVTDMRRMFYNCASLTTVPLFDTSSVTTMSNMFRCCSSLTTVPLFDTSSVTIISSMFDECNNLETVPLFNTSKVTSMRRMFYNCSALTTVPQFDTSNVTDMSYMFTSCSSLTTVPQFDTSNVTDMSSMFSYCSSLTTIPQLDTSKVTTMQYLCFHLHALTTVPALDARSVTNIEGMFNYCTNLTNVGGFINLGMASGLTTPLSKYTGPFYDCVNITRGSMLNIFNGLYDRATAGYSNLTLYFTADVINRLTEDDIAIATNKGWTISQ